MKKLLFMAAMATVSVFTAKAQSNEVATATLTHGNQTLVFTGKTALQEAYVAAADSGDVITLSSGIFKFEGDREHGASNRCSKSISIYGAGFENDTIKGTTPSQIVDWINLGLTEMKSEDGDGNIVVTTREAKKFYCEGVKLQRITFERDMKNVSLVKCHCDVIGFNEVVLENLTIRQSQIGKIGDTYMASCTFKNLYITNTHIGGIGWLSSSSTGKFDHCILTGYINDASWFVSNSIVYNSLPNGSTAKNNIFVGLDSSIGYDVQDINNNWTNVANAGVWAAEGEDGSYAENKTFELKYPEKYVGTDGTQVGLHGGDYPWNKIPSTPRIVESNIDTKTSADGKLKVSIKVEAQTKE